MVARNRLVVSGTIAGGLEVWSCSIDYRVAGGGSILDPAALQVWADSAAAALNVGVTNYPAITSGMGGFVNATKVSLYGYQATGPAVVTAVSDASWSGSGTVNKPFSTSLCVTKRTGRAGRSYRGRLYWPMLALAVGSNGKFTITQALADQFRDLFTDLGDTDGLGTLATPVVYSATANVVTDVTSVALGDVPDSQRNRRDGLTEVYTDSAI